MGTPGRLTDRDSLLSELAGLIAADSPEAAAALDAVETDALLHCAPDQSPEAALLAARVAWASAQEQAREEHRLEDELSHRLAARVRHLQARQQAKAREEALALYGRAHIGGGSPPPISHTDDPPSVADRIQAGEHVPATELERYVSDRLHSVSQSTARTVRASWQRAPR